MVRAVKCKVPPRVCLGGRDACSIDNKNVAPKKTSGHEIILLLFVAAYFFQLFVLLYPLFCLH